MVCLVDTCMAVHVGFVFSKLWNSSSKILNDVCVSGIGLCSSVNGVRFPCNLRLISYNATPDIVVCSSQCTYI